MLDSFLWFYWRRIKILYSYLTCLTTTVWLRRVWRGTWSVSRFYFFHLWYGILHHNRLHLRRNLIWLFSHSPLWCLWFRNSLNQVLRERGCIRVPIWPLVLATLVGVSAAYSNCAILTFKLLVRRVLEWDFLTSSFEFLLKLIKHTP